MRKIFTVLLTFICTVIFILPMSSKAATETAKAGKVNISSGKLNVRSSASSNSNILTTLNKDSYIVLISKSGSWWYVEYSDNKYTI